MDGRITDSTVLYLDGKLRDRWTTRSELVLEIAARTHGGAFDGNHVR